MGKANRSVKRVHLMGQGTRMFHHPACSQRAVYRSKPLLSSNPEEVTCKLCLEILAAQVEEAVKTTGPDFSVILQDPTLRNTIQEGMKRAYHDALFPRLLYKPSGKK